MTKKANVTITEGTDTPTLDDVRRTLRDELLDVARRHVEPTVRTPMPSASEWDNLTAAYVRLGGDLELEDPATRRDLMLAQERAVTLAVHLEQLKVAATRVIAEVDELGGGYFEGSAWQPLAAAIRDLENVTLSQDARA